MKLTIDNESYIIYFEDDSCPDNRWRLWVPECFLFDGDSERFPMRTAPAWEERGGAYTVTGESGDDTTHAARMKLLIAPKPGAIDLSLEVENIGAKAWSDYANPAFCLSNREAEDFADPDRERTFVIDASGQVRNAKPMIEQANAGKFDHLAPDMKDHAERYNHFPVGSRNDSDDMLQKFPVSSGWIARQNKTGDKTLVFTWDQAARVDTNFNVMTCIHSHPAIGPLAPGEKVTCNGHIAVCAKPPEACA